MHHVCFVLHPQFQMLAYVLASETLRIANRRAAKTVFTWETRTATAARIVASNGRGVDPDVAGWADPARLDLVLVIAGYEPLAVRPPGLAAFLQRADRRGAMLGGVDTGVSVLASLGLLRPGQRVVMHREAVAAFLEAWPDLAPGENVYAIDDRRMSAAGGTAMGDAMLAWIATRTSPAFAQEVAQDMAHGSIRPATQRQGSDGATDPVVLAMQDQMRARIGAPVELAVIARRLGLSVKRLRTRCVRATGRTPSRCFLDLRLGHARDLLHGTDMQVTEVALASGFGSPAGFARAFLKAFGRTPRQERQSAWRHAAAKAEEGSGDWPEMSGT
jgi:AraC family transcriptional regulator, carnitine catabolism transcriptional activator